MLIYSWLQMVLQKGVFRFVKGGLSGGKRCSFARQDTAFGKTACGGRQFVFGDGVTPALNFSPVAIQISTFILRFILFRLTLQRVLTKHIIYAEQAEISSDGLVLFSFGVRPKRFDRTEGHCHERVGIHIYGGSVGRRR
jgi:hypothetical protein